MSLPMDHVTFEEEYSIKFNNLKLKETHLKKIRLNSKDYLLYSGQKVSK